MKETNHAKIDISIIIVNWNTKQLLLDCIHSIYRTIKKTTFELFVVDNGSNDGSVDALKTGYPNVKVISNASNLGFAKANNLALKQMSGRYALLLNSDTVAKDDALDKMFNHMEANANIGISGLQLLNRDGSKQNSIGVFPKLLVEFGSKTLLRFLFPVFYKKIAEPQVSSRGEAEVKVDFIMGACMMVRKNAIDQIGMLDEDYFFYYEEIDWCYRMQKRGWSVCYIPGLEIYHFGGQSLKAINLRGRVESWRSRYLFFEKHLELSHVARHGLRLLGFALTIYQVFIYIVLNALTLFSVKRLRRRWFMFTYLLIWHMRGFPASMGVPR